MGEGYRTDSRDYDPSAEKPEAVVDAKAEAEPRATTARELGNSAVRISDRIRAARLKWYVLWCA